MKSLQNLTKICILGVATLLPLGCHNHKNEPAVNFSGKIMEENIIVNNDGLAYYEALIETNGKKKLVRVVDSDLCNDEINMLKNEEDCISFDVPKSHLRDEVYDVKFYKGKFYFDG